MIRETMIDAERDYVNERLCGVNDMTFDYSTYQYETVVEVEDEYVDEDDTFKDVEPPDLDEDDDDE